MEFTPYLESARVSGLFPQRDKNTRRNILDTYVCTKFWDRWVLCMHFYKTDYHTCQLHKHRKHDMIAWFYNIYICK